VKPATCLCAVIATIGGVGTASASLVDLGSLSINGAGPGAVPTILSVQGTGNAGSEAGCVAWTGMADVTGNCTTGFGTFMGGQEKPGASQTGTQLVSAALDENGYTGTISSYANLGLVMNVSQPGGGPITLTSLILTVYPTTTGTPKSVELTCPTGGCVFSSSSSGRASSDELFGISSDAVASLGAFSSSAHIRAAASFTGSAGGPESFFLAAIPAAAPTQSGTVPEPGSLTLIILGAIAVFCGRRRNKKISRKL
jgi:hypothetical protein